MKNKCALALLLVIRLLGASEEPYRLALPGYHYQFPHDHFNHPEYQTEWWYYTGNLRASDGHRFGFELTFFRQGANREASSTSTVWDVKDIWMAHLALSDIDGRRFFHSERLNRSGAGTAGADQAQARVWNGNWQAHWQTDKAQRLQAVAERFSFDLLVKSAQPPVINGINGVSQKAEGLGHASHYISLTRLVTSGVVIVDGKSFAVEGNSWMDHEFFTHQLEANQTGWDWFSLQLDDGSEIMLFRLRRKDGAPDPYSAGTYQDPQGRAVHLAVNDFSVTPGNKTWTSPDTGAQYPIEWTVRIPSLGIEVALTTQLPQQELTGKFAGSPAYWEGAVDIRGAKGNRPVRGAGYLEMTGYAGPVSIGGGQ